MSIRQRKCKRVITAFSLMEIMVTVAILSITSITTVHAIASGLRTEKLAVESLKAAWTCEGELIKIQTSGILDKNIPVTDQQNESLVFQRLDTSGNVFRWKMNTSENTSISVDLKMEESPIQDVYKIKIVPVYAGNDLGIPFEWTTYLKKTQTQ